MSTYSSVPWTEASVAVVSVDGSGGQPPDLVKLAVALIVGGQLQPVRTWLVHPPGPIFALAELSHGISETDVEFCPVAAAIKDEVMAVLSGVDVVAGHRLRIDLPMMLRAWPSWESPPALDTFRLARVLLPRMPENRLGALVNTLEWVSGGGVWPPGHSYRAEYITELVARLLCQLAGELAGALSRPVNVADLVSRGSLDNTDWRVPIAEEVGG